MDDLGKAGDISLDFLAAPFPEGYGDGTGVDQAGLSLGQGDDPAETGKAVRQPTKSRLGVRYVRKTGGHVRPRCQEITHFTLYPGCID